MTIYTIGFSQKSAEEFFGLLMENGVKTLVDIRLNNRSQLAGFTKARDLPFFLDKIAGIGYRHADFLAPTKMLLDGYKKEKISWPDYERIYLETLRERDLGSRVGPSLYENACLLCSEPTADRCHRRLAAEYLCGIFPERSIDIVHL
jgi:uncharacterized protein (DUF488 family)